MEPNDNIQNNNDSINESRLVKASGFVNEGVGSGDASGGMTHVDGGKDVVFQDKPKKSHGMLYGMILLAILAVGGIGFGVWAMMDGNSQVAKKDEQITDLRSQLVEKNEVVDDTTVVVDTDDYRNPIVKSSNGENIYNVGFTSSYYIDGNERYTLRISIINGAVDSCSVYTADGAFSSNCTIDGLNGEVFRVIEFGEGQSNVDSNIGFIMTDGSVQYFPFFDAMKNKDFTIKGNLDIDGVVVDAFEIAVGYTDPQVLGGYGSTVFILHDGSFMKYDNSMLK